MKDLLLIQSLDLQGFIEDYRTFFLALMPSVFIIAVIVLEEDGKYSLELTYNFDPDEEACDMLHKGLVQGLESGILKWSNHY